LPPVTRTVFRFSSAYIISFATLRANGVPAHLKDRSHAKALSAPISFCILIATVQHTYSAYVSPA